MSRLVSEENAPVAQGPSGVSLRTRITLIFTVLIVLLVAAAALLVKHDVENKITIAETQSALNMLDQVYTSIENEYTGYRYFEETLLRERKDGLKHITQIALEAIDREFKESSTGTINEATAKRQAMEIARSMRYAYGSGYVWIQDTTLPIPNMLMHPVVPGLEGEAGDEAIYYTALDGKKNLLAEFVKAAQQNNGTAFLDYRWPKPMPEGLTSMQPKCSHVRIFEPWGWLIGTGLYTDDIRDACRAHLDEITAAMAVTLSRIRLAQTGYVYVFDGDCNLLIHPRMQGTNGKHLKNPATGTYILYDIMAAAKDPAGKLEYPWNKPGEPEDRFYEKVAFVKYYEPLDWYVVASIYCDELRAPSASISAKILWGSLVFFLLAGVSASWLARSVSRPLSDLAKSAEKIVASNLAETDIPMLGTCETRSLGQSLQNMINRLDTEQKARYKAEELLHQSEKMQAIGHLAGGIAHDLNNMLAGIRGATELLSGKVHQDEEASEYIEIIADATSRAAELTRNLLNFGASRKGRSLAVPVNLHAVIEASNKLLERSIDKRISLSARLNAEATTVIGDPTLLQNAFLNLGINARDAIPDRGEIVFETNNVMITEEHPLTKSIGSTGLFIETIITDTGIGMASDVQKQIFEPFFTTKAEGKGTGLGLASVYRTVKEHHGDIHVQSEPGHGTVFKTYLPIDGSAVVIEVPEDKKLIRGEGCILLVDDEEIVLTICANRLRDLGYDVILAKDGIAAVEIFRNSHDKIDLVLLDVVMPRMGGRDAYYELRKIDPDVKVVFCSGFTNEFGIEKLVKEQGLAFIAKPYSATELSQVVAETLNPDYTVD